MTINTPYDPDKYGHQSQIDNPHQDKRHDSRNCVWVTCHECHVQQFGVIKPKNQLPYDHWYWKCPKCAENIRKSKPINWRLAIEEQERLYAQHQSQAAKKTDNQSNP